MEKYYDITNCLEFPERAAANYPDKIAFADDRESVTFKQFMEVSRGIGSALKQYELKKEAVAILMDARHIPNLEVSMGILYAGCFYIPLDPTLPAERVRVIFEKLNPSLVIYDHSAETLKDTLGDAYRFVAYDSLLHTPIDMEYLREIRARSNYFDLLFIMFTSGSTGIPKGVVHTHKDLIRFSLMSLKRFSFTEDTVFANQSPFYYANCVFDIYPPLAGACTVQILPAAVLNFPKKMIEMLRELKVTEICMTPSSFHAVAEAGVLQPGCLPDLEHLVPSGEAANWKFMQDWAAAAAAKGKFWNFYGSTELLSVALWTVDREFRPDEIIPAGYPYRSAHILILDEEGRECPAGTTGELYIHNEWMFSGYYNDPERNKACLINDPLKKGWEEIFFRTGDMGFLNEYGELVIVGRKDTMIKHKGYRMELGEVEYAAKGANGVGNCCCILDREAEAGDLYLFYTGTCTEKELKAKLKATLPRYAIPEHIIHLEQMPYNANRKADRRQLAGMIAKHRGV